MLLVTSVAMAMMPLRTSASCHGERLLKTVSWSPIQRDNPDSCRHTATWLQLTVIIFPCLSFPTNSPSLHFLWHRFSYRLFGTTLPGPLNMAFRVYTISIKHCRRKSNTYRLLSVRESKEMLSLNINVVWVNSFNVLRRRWLRHIHPLGVVKHPKGSSFVVFPKSSLNAQLLGRCHLRSRERERFTTMRTRTATLTSKSKKERGM